MTEEQIQHSIVFSNLKTTFIEYLCYSPEDKRAKLPELKERCQQIHNNDGNPFVSNKLATFLICSEQMTRHIDGEHDSDALSGARALCDLLTLEVLLGVDTAEHERPAAITSHSIGH